MLELIYVAILIAVVAWLYVYGYHVPIEYLSGTNIPTGQINNVIETVNKQRFSNIQLLSIDEEERHTKRHIQGTNDTVVKACFSVTVGLSVELALLILSELMDWKVAYLFHFIIDLLTFMLAIVVPALIINLMTTNRFVPQNASKSQKLVMVGGYIGWYLTLNQIGRICDFNLDKSIIDYKINQISLLGVIINLALSGIGSCTVIHKIIRQFQYKKSISIHHINGAIGNYNNIKRLIDKRQQLLNQVLVNNSGKVYNKGLLHKVQSFANLKIDEEEELNQEIRSLTKMKSDSYKNICKSIRQYQSSGNRHFQQAETIFNCAFAGYCVYRVLFILAFKLPNLNSAYESKDALAITLAKVLGLVIQFDSEQRLINQLSFLISSSLFLLTISSVVNTLKSFGRFFPTFPNIPKKWISSLVISELFGIFVISTCLLIRVNLPEEMSLVISRILSLSKNELQVAEEIKFIDNLFEVVYLASFIVGGVGLYLNDQLQEFDEEESIEGHV